MKIKVFAVILIFILILPLGVYADSDAFTFTPNKDFIGAYKNENKEKLASKLGISEKDAQKLFEGKDLEYFAISKDRTTQLGISVYSNDLSALVGDTSRLDDESLKGLANSLSESENSAYEIQTVNGTVYVVFNEEIENSKGNNYYESQYITAFGGDFYHLTFITSKPSEKEKIKDIVSSFKITEEKNKPISVAYIILMVLAIAAFIAVATVMLIGIIKRLKQRKLQKTENEEKEYKSITEE